MATYKKAKAKLEELDLTYSAYDFKWASSVIVFTEEHSFLLFRSAFVKKWKDWYLVFAEHHAPEAFHEEDNEVLFVQNMEIPEIE